MEKDQIFLIKQTKIFLSRFYNKKNFKHKSSIFYLSTNSDLGLYILNSLGNLKKISFFVKFKIIFKNIIFILRYLNPKILAPSNNFFYNRVILTWAFEENFNKDGSIKDKYFNINSNTLKNTLWLVIFMGNKIPDKINKNIFLITNSKKVSLNLFAIFKIIIKNLIYIFKDFKYYLALISSDNYFADIIIKKFEFLFNNKVKTVLLPYEGQVFQNKLIYKLKEKTKIKVIGYIHSPPMAMPTNFIKKNGSPDTVIVNGNDQKYCFQNLLGWKNENIKVLPSFRFLKQSKKFKNTIFLPISILNIAPVLKSIETLHSKKLINLRKFQVRGHPALKNNLKNIILINRIKKLIKSFPKNNKFKYKNNFSLFIGISGAIIEELEKGANVIQISENPIFDSYTNKLYPSLTRKIIDKNIFSYKLKTKGNLIKLGSKKNNLKRIASL